MQNKKCCSNLAMEQAPAFPVRVSENGRYFVDADNKPFFIQGDTAWKLFWEFTKEEAEDYLDNRKRKGFTVIQVQMLPHRDYQANRNGDTPFLVRGDMTTANPAYFEHVDWVIGKAMEKGLGMLIAPAWASKWEQDWYKHLNIENVGSYASYLANRYKNFKNIIGWIHGGDDDALALHETIRTFGRVMKTLVPYQLHTFHGLIKGGWQFFHNEPWYDFNMAYAYDYIEMLKQLKEAYGLKPVKPVFLGETHYEYNLDVTSAHIRKYAWTSVLLGTAGQTYGNKDIWMATYFWRSAMEAPAAIHLTYMKKFFSKLQWEKLKPDLTHSIVTEGYGNDENYAPAACAEDGSVIVAYIPSGRTVTLDLRPGADMQAYWFDPASGMSFDPETPVVPGENSFKTPGKNSEGDEDWVLLLK